MKIRIREGNDFDVAWAITRAGQPEDLSTAINMKLTLVVYGLVIEHNLFTVADNLLNINIPKEVTTVNGDYRLIFEYTLPDAGQPDGDLKCKTDVVPFRIVPFTAKADDIYTINVTSDIAIGLKGDKGDDGADAYQIWLDLGNVGTYEDFIAYLRQPAVDAGASISELEGAIQVSEGLRVQAESERVNAETERQITIQEAVTATQEATTAASLADTARLAIQDDLALKANQTDLAQLAGDTKQPDRLYGVEDIGTRGVNLFNKFAITEGGYYDSVNDAWVDDDNYVSSDFIPILPGKYKKSDTAKCTLYDSNKVFLGGAEGLSTINIASSRFIRLAIPKLLVDTYMFSKEEEYPSTYVPFGVKYKFDPEVYIFDEEYTDDGLEKLIESSGENLVYKSTVRTGFVSNVGTINATPGTGQSNNYNEYVRINGSVEIVFTLKETLTQPIRVAFYDEGYTFLGWESSSAQITKIVSPENAYWFRFSYQKGSIPIVYTTHGTKSETADIALSSVFNNPDKIIGIDKIHTNLFDKSTITEGGYYDSVNGAWVDDDNYVSSNFIPVLPGKYKKSDTSKYTLYNDNKVFLGGEPGTATPNIASSRFIRLAIPKLLVDTYMFSKEEEYPSTYVPFGVKYKFDPEVYIFDEEYTDDGNADIDTVVRISDNFNSIRSGLLGHLEPIELYLPDFSGYNQPYHPSVIYIADGFADYNYWMSQTPYPIGAVPYRDRWECPIVYKSMDGIEWEVVADPLDDLTEIEIQNEGYFSDSHILFRPDLNRIEVWYRLSPSMAVEGLPVILYRKVSTDGVNWSEREELFPPVDYRTIDNHRSPSILWDNDNKLYRMWYTSNPGKFYRTSPDGFNWSSPIPLNFNVPHNDWHIDVNYYQGKYHYIGYNSGFKHINYYSSNDGINFRFEKLLLQSEYGGSLYSRDLYRSISMLDGEGKVRLYFSGVKTINRTCVGVIIANSLLEVSDQIKINGKYVITSTGKTLDDLEAEIELLKSSN